MLPVLGNLSFPLRPFQRISAGASKGTRLPPPTPWVRTPRGHSFCLLRTGARDWPETQCTKTVLPLRSSSTMAARNTRAVATDSLQ